MSFIVFLTSIVATAIPVLEKRAELFANDTKPLRLAQHLENLEHAFYSEVHAKFNEAQFIAAGYPHDFRWMIGTIAAQESIHATALGPILSSAGRKVVPPCSYKFSYQHLQEYIEAAEFL
jgi:hypothetical protein